MVFQVSGVLYEKTIQVYLLEFFKPLICSRMALWQLLYQTLGNPNNRDYCNFNWYRNKSL